ncbi:MAG: hypothetical protein AUJ52_14085 [Elusimicrobia bacterium CG1_02_63_36]|nr:MAG: hypothetical protein AUJ52_14085 [Elusimicrobia bacterium CG1_02_63_36]PIP81458.1 MAG: hypothetical protein COR54_20180 [Elusimicrobia bacterium CG22_combo_CG10-13_8_21_14_all_63_91]PJA17042.1 MAG: hypothetical protein COX66_05930 [Elusimicrobia bacterium CG_4_10_14_0_2_um_filter_63_34]PJB25072.1 MAG: hypothetical protein CO113_10420 [Elusimicrobia bacterium CG_4_9_14_3_um_filter_62_55]
MTASPLKTAAARLWAVSPRDPQAARWRELLKSAGAHASERLKSLNALAQAAGERSEGIALVDAALLAGRANEGVTSLRRRCPGVRLLVVCEEVALEGPDLADALSAGALDYLRASRSDDELVEKLRAHLTRLYPGNLRSEGAAFDDLRIDWRCREISVRRGRGWKSVEALTPKEFELLRAFVELRGNRISRGVLLDRVWKGKGGDVNPESLDKAVGSLRRKLGAAGRRIVTIRGFGYSFKP